LNTILLLLEQNRFGRDIVVGKQRFVLLY